MNVMMCHIVMELHGYSDINSHYLHVTQAHAYILNHLLIPAEVT